MQKIYTEAKKNGISSNILRCIATLFVFLLHGRSYLTKIDELPYILNCISWFPAWAGVWIFLFLSGYGVGYGFFSGKYKLYKDNRISWKLFIKFYLGRFIKIAPIYYIYCIVFEILSGNMFFYNNQQILLKIITFTFNGNGGIDGLGHLWYISLAMQLYLFMPFIYLALDHLKDKRAWMLCFCVLAVFGCFIRCYIVNNGYNWYTYSYTNCLTNVDLITLGMMVSQIKQKVTLSIKNKRIIKGFACSFFFILVIYNCWIYKMGTANYIFIYRCILPTAYAICCSLILLLSNISKNGANNFIDRMINSFSKYSYAFYIYHIAVFKYVNLTLLHTNRFCKCSALSQYIAFFSICFIANLALAIPFTYIGEVISLKYSKIERKVPKLNET